MKKSQNPIVRKSFAEVFNNPPAITQSTARKYGKKRAQKQKVAIALSKARKAGAKIPY